jgi:hypothetical protein
MTIQLAQAKGLSDLVKPSYSPGLMLQDDDLTRAVDYTRDLSRLLLKSLFGCGVVCGFEVTNAPGECNEDLIIGPGVAIDGRGDPVQLTSAQRIPLNTRMPASFWITNSRRDVCCAKRDITCEVDEDSAASVFTQVRDGYEIRLVAENPSRDACSCIRKDAADSAQRGQADPPPYDVACYQDHTDAKCSCHCGSDAEGVVLAYVKMDTDQNKVTAIDHRVRRFIRPALLRDPWLDKDPKVNTVEKPAAQTSDTKPTP